MKNWLIFKPFIDFYKMFFTENGGFSWRKITATFSVVYVAANLSLSVKDEKLKVELVSVWLFFASVLIGLIAIPQIIQIIGIVFNKKQDENKPTGN